MRDARRSRTASRSKSLRFAAGTVDELVNTKYGQPDAFALLSILYGHVDPSRTNHIDHIFPRAHLRRDRLREAGYDDDDVEYIVKHARDGLGNRQLLPGLENIGKSAKMPLEWARTKYPDPQALDGYLEQNDMSDLPEDLAGFRAFFDAPRERLRSRLLDVLGREPGSLAQAPTAAK